MTFLAIDSQKMFMMQEKSELEYQEVVYSSNLQTITQNLADLSAAGCDMESNEVQELQYYQQLYEQRQASIESQLKVLNSEIESFDKTVTNNIKSECKLNMV